MRIILMLLAISMVIVGCAHDLSLIPRKGGERGYGIAQKIGKTVTINLNGKTYSGKYVYDEGSVAYSSGFGTSTAYSGARSATAYGSSFRTTYVPGSGNGRILVTSSDGDAIRCELQYLHGSGIGICEDNAGNIYDLMVHN